MKKVVYSVQGVDDWLGDIKWRHQNGFPTAQFIEDGRDSFILELHVNEEHATLLKMRHPEAEITKSDYYDEP